MNKLLRNSLVRQRVAEIRSLLEQAERTENPVPVPWPEDTKGCYEVQQTSEGVFQFSRIHIQEGRRVREELPAKWSATEDNLQSYLANIPVRSEAAPANGGKQWRLLLACPLKIFSKVKDALSSSDQLAFELDWLGPFLEDVPVHAHCFAVQEFRLFSRDLPTIRTCTLRGPYAMVIGPTNGAVGALQCSLAGVRRLHVRGRIWIFLPDDSPIPNFDPIEAPGTRIWSWDTTHRVSCWRIRKPTEVIP